MIDLSRRTGCHLLCVHHSNKSRESTGLDAINGSVGFSGAIDTGLALSRLEKDRAVFSHNRYGTELPPTRLVLDTTTGIITPAGPAALDAVGRHTARIIALLNDGQPRWEVEIKDEIGGNHTATARALRQLCEVTMRPALQGRGGLQPDEEAEPVGTDSASGEAAG